MAPEEKEMQDYIRNMSKEDFRELYEEAGELLEYEEIDPAERERKSREVKILAEALAEVQDECVRHLRVVRDRFTEAEKIECDKLIDRFTKTSCLMRWDDGEVS